LQELITKHKVELKQFPEPVLKELKKLSMEVLEEVAASDPMSRKVYDSFLEFQKTMIDWNKLTEEMYQKYKYL
ncbi:MAG: ABC transporter substrate-binding protein, partial [Desulfobacterales bacterium]|nr:ABC transporter substrate-binding protein [Desulfobacterales bacterium]